MFYVTEAWVYDEAVDAASRGRRLKGVYKAGRSAARGHRRGDAQAPADFMKAVRADNLLGRRRAGLKRRGNRPPPIATQGIVTAGPNNTAMTIGGRKQAQLAKLLSLAAQHRKAGLKDRARDAVAIARDLRVGKRW